MKVIADAPGIMISAHRRAASYLCLADVMSSSAPSRRMPSTCAQTMGMACIATKRSATPLDASVSKPSARVGTAPSTEPVTWETVVIRSSR